MAGQTDLAGNHDEIPELCAPGTSRLGNKDATPTEHDVVTDLHQIINHRTRADDRIRPGTAIDRGVGADFDIIADNHTPQLRDLDMAARARGKAEAVLTDAHAGIERDAVADQAMADGDVGRDHTVAADHDAGADDRIMTDLRAGADFRTGLDHGVMTNRHFLSSTAEGSITALAAIPASRSERG